MQDIQGPKIRTGKSSDNTILEKSKNVDLTNTAIESNKETVFIDYDHLLRDVNVEDRVFIDDGQIVLKIVKKKKDKLTALVLIGGELRDNQGVAFPDSNHADELFFTGTATEVIGVVSVDGEDIGTGSPDKYLLPHSTSRVFS